jgi:hypothetical protein
MTSNFIGGYYQKLAEGGLLPSPHKFQKRANSVILPATELKNQLRSPSNDLARQA